MIWMWIVLGILLFAAAPAIAEYAMYLAGSATGVLPWLLLYTVPIGVVALLVTASVALAMWIR